MFLPVVRATCARSKVLDHIHDMCPTQILDQIHENVEPRGNLSVTHLTFGFNLIRQLLDLKESYTNGWAVRKGCMLKSLEVRR